MWVQVAEDPISALTYGLLFGAILSLWIARSTKASILVYALACATALVAGRLHPVGLLQIIAFATLSFFFYRKRTASLLHLLDGLILSGLALGFFSHLLPGFANWNTVSKAQLCEGCAPYSSYLNFDSASVGFFLLLFGDVPARSRYSWRYVVKYGALGAAIAIPVVLALSLAFGFVRLDLKLPSFTPLWALQNLLFTCVAEEAFFRGFVQRSLTQSLSPKFGTRYGSWIGLALASALFGLRHFPGGMLYVLLATVAGAVYGWIYRQTQKIEAAVVAHFLLNAVHFLAFSYPFLMK